MVFMQRLVWMTSLPTRIAKRPDTTQSSLVVGQPDPGLRDYEDMRSHKLHATARCCQVSRPLGPEGGSRLVPIADLTGPAAGTAHSRCSSRFLNRTLVGTSGARIRELRALMGTA